MNLRTILQLPEFIGLDDQAALDHGNTLTIVAQNDQAFSWSGINQALALRGVGIQDIERFNANTDGLAGWAILNNCLGSKGGLILSDPLNRMVIQGFEIKEPDYAVNILEVMLAIGITMGTKWQSWDIPVPTVEEIALARSESQFAKEWWPQMVYELVPPLLQKGYTKEQIIAAITGAS